MIERCENLHNLKRIHYPILIIKDGCEQQKYHLDKYNDQAAPCSSVPVAYRDNKSTANGTYFEIQQHL
jgi:hypothetical protein